MRNAASESQSSHSDKTITASSDGDVVRVKILVDLKPSSARSHAEDRVIKAQDGGIEPCHVDRDTSIYVCKACAGRMALAFDSHAATVSGGNDGHGPRHVFRCRGMQDTPRLQSRFLQRPVRALSAIVG